METEILVHIYAVLSNMAILELDLLHEFLIPVRLYLASARTNVDEPSNKTGLRICDLDRLVRTHEQKCIDATRIWRLELLVDQHLLVRDD